MEPTSQQELKQLLDEGKISEEEYQGLKRVMAENNMDQSVEQEKGENKPNSVHKLGKIALVLTLGGVIIPAIIYLVVDILRPLYFSVHENISSVAICILLFLSMELAGFVTGIISWKDGLGKAAAITAGILLLLSVLLLVKFVA